MRIDVRTEADLACAGRRLTEGILLDAPRAVGAATTPRLHSAEELYSSDMEVLDALIDGLLYDGLTMLVAKPKEGKSWLALQLAIAIAGGRGIDGIEPRETGRVLFLALEEPKPRTVNRLRKLAAPGPWVGQLDFVYELLPLMAGGLDQIRKLLAEHKPRFVVLDTLTALVKASKRGSDVFRSQYEEINSLRQLCADAEICCLLVHHTRKGQADGLTDAVAGTGGIAAAVDTIWRLRRKGDATLEVVGREVEERTFALQFCREEPFGWRFVGEGHQAFLSPERTAVLDLLKRDGPLRSAQIAASLKKNTSTIRSLIQRLHDAGYLTRDDDALYSIAEVTLRARYTHSLVDSVDRDGIRNVE